MWRHVGVGTFYATLARAVAALNPHSFTRYGANDGPVAALGKESCVFRAADGCMSVLVLEPATADAQSLRAGDNQCPACGEVFPCYACGFHDGRTA